MQKLKTFALDYLVEHDIDIATPEFWEAAVGTAPRVIAAPVAAPVVVPNPVVVAAAPIETTDFGCYGTD